MTKKAERKHPNCLLCGASIPETRYKSARYCCAEHAKEARARQWKSRPPPARGKSRDKPQTAARTTGLITCIVCDNALPIGASANRKTCSDTCLGIHRGRYLREYVSTLRSRMSEAEREEASLRAEKSRRKRRGQQRLSAVETFLNDRNR